MSIFGMHDSEWDVNQIGDQFSYLSYSKIKKLLEGEWDFVSHYVMGRRKPKSDSMRKGDLLHKALLQPEKFMGKFVVKPKFAGKGAKTFEAEWAAKQSPDAEIMTESEVLAVNMMLNSVRLHPTAHKVLSNGMAERKVVTKIEDVVVLIIPDLVHQTGVFTDLKTAKSVDPKWFGRDCFNYGYYIQAAIYQDGLNEALNMHHDHVVYVAVQNALPYNVQPFLMEQQDLSLGRATYLPVLRRYAGNIERYRKAHADCQQYQKAIADATEFEDILKLEFEMERDMRDRFLPRNMQDITPVRMPHWAYSEIGNVNEDDL